MEYLGLIDYNLVDIDTLKEQVTRLLHARGRRICISELSGADPSGRVLYTVKEAGQNGQREHKGPAASIPF